MKLMCRQCGYDARPLVADSSTQYTCPECGMHETAVRWYRSRSLRWRLMCVLVIDAVAAAIVLTPLLPPRESVFLFFFIAGVVPLWIVVVADAASYAEVGCSRAVKTVAGGWLMGLAMLMCILIFK